MTTTNTNGTRVPIIRPGQALQSLRDSGHSLPTALGEPIDNSLEAKANNVYVHLAESTNSRGKKHVHRITVADDGDGMDEHTMHLYLQLGFSTRYMRTDTIGKYGVGAKLAALNFGRRIDVWSRQDPDEPWLHVYFDLDEALEAEKRGEEVGVDPPDQEPLPDRLVENLSIPGPLEKGTVVVWSNVDRLEEGRLAASFEELRYEVEKELARIFRYFIVGGIKFFVNGRALLAHDPLFVMENTWADKLLTDTLPGDKRPAKGGLQHFPAKNIRTESIKIGDSRAEVRITLYPKEVVRRRGMGGDELARKLRVPENEGSMSFVRLNREISYTNVPKIFPRGVEDADRFIGIEVCFRPDMDNYFGVRNVKRGVEPHGELREKIREVLAKYLPQARNELEALWGQAAREQQAATGEHAPIVNAAANVNRTMPKPRVEEAPSPEEAQQLLEDLARDVAGQDTQKQQEYLEKIKDRPFVVESVDFPGNMFMTVHHIGQQVVIRLNTRHRFYREMWEPIKSISERDAGSVSGTEAVRTARRTIEALTLLVIAYGKAESMHARPSEQYSDLVTYWGQFLNTLMMQVKDVL
jgi:hypothetical protein